MVRSPSPAQFTASAFDLGPVVDGDPRLAPVHVGHPATELVVLADELGNEGVVGSLVEVGRRGKLLDHVRR